MSQKTDTSQANFDLLFKNHPVPMWIYDLKTLAFLEVNDAAVEKYGYKRKTFLSMTLKDIRPEEDVSKLFKDISKKRPALQHSGRWRHKLNSGKVIDVEITSHTIDYNGCKAALVIAKDVTDQKREQERITKLNRIYAVLSDVNQTIVRNRNADELFKNICRIALEKGGFVMTWIGMIDEKENKIKTTASAGLTGDYFSNINIDLNDKLRGGGPIGLAIKTGKHIISNNIEEDERMFPLRKEAAKSGFNSSAAFPIKMFGKVVGVFNLYSPQVNFFDDEETKLLDEMAMDLSFALEFIEKEKERKETEEKLKITQFGIDHSQIGVYQIDEEGNINYANEQACKSLGYTYEELTSLSMLDIDPTFSLEKWKEHRKNIRKKSSGTIETIHKRKDRTEFYVEVSINYFDYDGKKLSFSFAKDITERKHTEKKLREGEENLRIILESTADGILVVDNKGKVIKTNKRFADLWHIPPAILSSEDDNVLLKFVLNQLIDPEQFLNKVRQLYNSIDENLDTLFFKDGRIYERFSTPLLMRDKVIGRVWSFRNITERKLAEEAMRKKDEHYKTIIENIFKFIPEGVLVFTESMNLLKQNKAFGDIVQKYAPVLGYTAEELTQKIIEQLSSEISAGEKTEIRIPQKS